MEEFKEKVREMVKLDDDISQAAGMLKELRGRKTDLNREIMGFMKNENIKSCNVPDGKLSLSTSRSLSTVKKEDIAKAFAEALQQDVGRCEAILDEVYGNRRSTERTVLKRTRKRSRANAQEDEDVESTAEE